MASQQGHSQGLTTRDAATVVPPESPPFRAGRFNSRLNRSCPTRCANRARGQSVMAANAGVGSVSMAEWVPGVACRIKEGAQDGRDVPLLFHT